MSRNTGANGTFYLPKSSYGKIVKSLIAKHLELSIPEYTKINTIIEKTTTNMKGKHNVQWYDALCYTLDETYLKDRSGHYTLPLPFQVIDPYSVFYTACLDNKKPKKVVPHTFKSTSEELNFDFACEAGVIMNKEKCSLQIVIAYNNHSLEKATASAFYKAVVNELKQVPWTSKTGGIVYFTQEEDESFYHSPTSSHSLLKFGNPEAIYTPKASKPKI